MTVVSSKYHFLLIGIDDYTIKPLAGCVNDIDAIQRILLDQRVGIRKEQITRLASPRPRSVHDEAVHSRPATLSNIRSALERLGSDEIKKSDRVFIYYSGHGARAPVATDSGTIFREALVPADFEAQPGAYRLLFDFEVNRLLVGVAAKAAAVTVVLDCCHSAGTTREARAEGDAVRSIDLLLDAGLRTSIALPNGLDSSVSASAPGVRGNLDDCQIVAACLDHEVAHERRGIDGRSHGLLTRALIEQLGTVTDTSLLDVPWGRIWQGVRIAVATANPAQHVWLTGSQARAVFGSVDVEADPGLSLRRTGANKYALDAGTLAGVGKGAKVAVYGPLPLRFPPLGSTPDKEARLSEVLLEVTDARRASAVAAALGAPFDVPSGVRGRIIEPGAPDRLRCALMPTEHRIVDALAKSPLLEVVDADRAQVVLRKEGEAWALIDFAQRARPDYPKLCRLNADQIDAAVPLLEHYFHYRLPLQMAMACTDLPGALSITVLACPDRSPLELDEQDGIRLPVARIDREFSYDLRPGERIAVRIHNGSSVRLKVTLLNAAASGKVQYLGEQVIDARAYAIFWHANTRGRPFTASLPVGTEQGIDRLITIGTDEYGTDLRRLRLDSTFADALARRRGGTARDLGDDDLTGPPIDRWTAHQVIVRCRKEPPR